MNRIVYISTLLVFVFSSCENHKPKPIDDNPSSLSLTPTNLPFNIATANINFYQDIKYDSFGRNKFDFFEPKSETKTPLVIFYSWRRFYRR